MDHYKVLGVTVSATDDEIKRAYKKLAIKYHPDKSKDPAHHALFIQIKEAYETLTDSQKRARYDRENGTGVGRAGRPATGRGAGASAGAGAGSWGYGGGGAAGAAAYSQSQSQGQSHSHSHSQTHRPNVYEGFTSSFYEMYRRFGTGGGDRTGGAYDRERREQAEKIRREQQERERKEQAEKIRRDQQARERRELHDRLAREEYIRQKREEQHEREAERAAYQERKREAYRQAWQGGPTNRRSPDTQKGTNSSDPIVLSDDEDEFASANESQEEEDSLEEEEEEEPRQYGTQTAPVDVDVESPTPTRTPSGDGRYASQNVKAETGSSREKSAHAGRGGGGSGGISDFLQNIGVTCHADQGGHDPLSFSQTLWEAANGVTRDTFSTRQRSQPSYSRRGTTMSPRRGTSPQRGGTSPSRGTSPQRSTPRRDPATTFPKPGTAPLSNIRNTLNEFPNKKSKVNPLDLDDLEATLEKETARDFNLQSNISDLYNDLPHVDQDGSNFTTTATTPGKRQRRSNPMFSSKRQRQHEFTDSNVQPETLYRPVNASPKRGHSTSTLSLSDLGAYPEIRWYTVPVAPRIDPLQPHMLSVAQMKKYDREFHSYSQKIFQYQQQRRERDEEHQARIYANKQSFNVYRQCLEQDFLVAEQYASEAHKHREVVTEFQRLFFP
ncbi:hypothetical protein CAAN3_05S00936 [[Candida] anglica]